MRIAAALLSTLAACGGYATSTTPAAEGDPVERAALPYAIVDARSGRAVSEADLYAALTGARAVCIGEDHPDPHHHWAQLSLVRGLAERTGGRRLALGLEMVQTPFQGVLDDWSADKIDEDALLQRTGWSDRWGYDFLLYRPMLIAARDSGMAILALNAPRELVKAVSKKGVDGLTADEKARLPALVLDDAQHRAWFDGVMAEMGDGHGHAMPDPDNIYAAQVVWDESMAERARAWLAEGEGTIVILAGNGHCHDSAIVRRLVRRGGAPTLSIRPVVDDGEGNVAAALAEARNDYLFVMTRPARREDSSPPSERSASDQE